MAAIRPSLRVRNRVRGFTLIEMLIVVVLVGVLLGVAVPGLGRSVTQDRVRRAGMVVQGMLDEAARTAQRRGRPVEITVDGNWLRITERGSLTPIKQRSFGPAEDIKATLAIAPSGGITVFPNGRGSAALTLTLSGGGQTVTVTRTTTGIVRRN